MNNIKSSLHMGIRETIDNERFFLVLRVGRLKVDIKK